jgi:hypothetical protein
MSYPRKSTTILAANDYCREPDWDAMVDAANGMNIAGGVTIQYPCNFIIRNIGGVYDAISGNGVLTYGGSSDANGVDGGDAAAVINAAITSLSPTGGLIFVSKGSYTLTSSIIIAAGITLQGAGSGATVFVFDTGIVAITRVGIGAITRVHLRDFRIEGDLARIDQFGISLNDLSMNCSIINVECYAIGGIGVYLNRVYGLSTFNLRIYWTQLNGLYLDDVNEGNYDVYIGSCAQDGVSSSLAIKNGAILRFTGTISYSGGQGVHIEPSVLYGSEQIVFDTVYFEGNAAYQAHLKKVGVRDVVGVKFRGCYFNSVEISPRDIVIEGAIATTIEDCDLIRADVGADEFIWVIGGSTGTRIERTRSDETADFVVDSGTDTRYRDNPNFVTETYIVSTNIVDMGLGVFAFTFAHGLAGQPGLGGVGGVWCSFDGFMSNGYTVGADATTVTICYMPDATVPVTCYAHCVYHPVAP